MHKALKRAHSLNLTSPTNYQRFECDFENVQGYACEVKRNVCPNQCSGRGECIDSYCHCDPPYWGIGCGRSKAYNDDQVLPHPLDFKIYMYELPASVAYQQSYWGGWTGHDPIYTAYQHFMEQFLQSNVRTENPYEAHMFFLPALTYAYTSNLGYPDFHISRVIDYALRQLPFWNRTEGRDHFVWTPEDRGSCLLESPETQALIKLTHFGYFDHTAGGKYKLFLPVGSEKWGCYHPLRDVVTPPLLPYGGMYAWDTYVERLKSRNNPLPNRTELFFFAGGFRPDDPEYAGGTREVLAKWVPIWNDPEIQVVKGSVGDYEETLRSSKFCLAPYGHGWGLRIVSAMVCGCVPIIIQEHVYQPFEDLLPYEEFSIRLNNDDIPNLPQILRSVTPEQHAALQHGLEKYWPAFVWDRDHGGKAFDYTALSLRRRYLNMKSKYYGRHQPDEFRRRLTEL